MKELLTLADLDAVLAAPKGRVALYKHSTQCGVSDTALAELEAFLELHPGADIRYLDLLAHRDVSNEIARRLGVKHESPQLIFLADGKVEAVLNHRAIRGPAIARALNV
ncbi:MAG: bacillithiol system redox-active protein YtxJ [Planctomycetes bacterium]|nr:bacillithiol system redox-active protein YtxJ [Planctomycetota bacterium]